MAKKKSVSADEVGSRSENDPESVANRDDRSARRQERARRAAEDEAAILDELRIAGVVVESIYDFVNNRPATPLKAVPVLIAHLQKAHLPSIREGIIRGLTASHFRDLALEPLIEQFRRESDWNLRWVIANALSTMASISELTHVEGIDQFAEIFK